SRCRPRDRSAPLRTRPLDHARGHRYQGPRRLPGPDSHRQAIVNLSLLRHTVLLFLMTPEQSRRTTRKHKRATGCDAGQKHKRIERWRQAITAAPVQPGCARNWGTIASARRDREIVSPARLFLVISKRVSDLSADPPDACSRAAGQLTRRGARLLQSPRSGTVAGGHALAAGIAQEQKPRARSCIWAKPSVRIWRRS